MLQAGAWSEAEEGVLGADGVLFTPVEVILTSQDGYQFAGISGTGFVHRQTVWQKFCTNQFIHDFQSFSRT
jgi:hypothetical protein